eukprot:8623654-Pyramimonas_sp.AAC.2
MKRRHKNSASPTLRVRLLQPPAHSPRCKTQSLQAPFSDNPSGSTSSSLVANVPAWQVRLVKDAPTVLKGLDP